jgi:hypothetical protein
LGAFTAALDISSLSRLENWKIGCWMPLPWQAL